MTNIKVPYKHGDVTSWVPSNVERSNVLPIFKKIASLDKNNSQTLPLTLILLESWNAASNRPNPLRNMRLSEEKRQHNIAIVFVRKLSPAKRIQRSSNRRWRLRMSFFPQDVWWFRWLKWICAVAQETIWNLHVLHPYGPLMTYSMLAVHSLNMAMLIPGSRVSVLRRVEWVFVSMACECVILAFVNFTTWRYSFVFW